ncbi:MAG: hypothetical protein JXR83_20480 [Deltaproteobacteria bacterium]|nr:hypothetical protein [Deltaproteobacteria bacterium]
MATIAVDWAGLEAAFENHSPEVRSFLDRETGEVITIIGDDEGERGGDVRVHPERYLQVEPIPSREQYRIMERFIATVPFPTLAERLSDAIVGKGAFRRFKDCIAQHPDERKRWFAFRDVLVHQFILDWCKANHVEATAAPDWAIDLPPPPEVTGEELPLAVDDEQRPETADLKRYLQAWARAHGEEYQYLFGPSAFDRLAEDLTQEFNLFRRR